MTFLFIFVIAISFFLAGFLSNPKRSKFGNFSLAFAVEFLILSFVGICIWDSGYGFFEGKPRSFGDLMLVFPISFFMAALIGLKAAYPEIK